MVDHRATGPQGVDRKFSLHVEANQGEQITWVFTHVFGLFERRQGPPEVT
jgi:hypothetical protein